MSDFTTRDGCWEAFIDQKNRADALEAKLAACEWKPITEMDLPKVGEHEIGVFVSGEWFVSACKHSHSFAHYRSRGGTHFRAINPPQQEAK